jgi:hypothetical protein
MTVYYSTGTGINSQTRSPSTPVFYNQMNSTLEFLSQTAQLMVSVYDISGKEIFVVRDVTTQDGWNSVQLPELSRGHYFATVASNYSIRKIRFFATGE